MFVLSLEKMHNKNYKQYMFSRLDTVKESFSETEDKILPGT